MATPSPGIGQRFRQFFQSKKMSTGSAIEPTSGTTKSDDILRSVYGMPAMEQPTLVPSASRPVLPPKTPTSPQRILPTRLPPLVRQDHITPFTPSASPKFRVVEPSSQTFSRQRPRDVSSEPDAGARPYVRSASLGPPAGSQRIGGSLSQNPASTAPSNYVWDAWEQAVVGDPRSVYRPFTAPGPPNVLSPAQLFPHRPPTVAPVPSWAPPVWYPPPAGYYPVGPYSAGFQPRQSFGTFPRGPRQRTSVDAVIAADAHEEPIIPTTYQAPMTAEQTPQSYTNGASSRRTSATRMYPVSTATESKGDAPNDTSKRYSIARTSPLETDLSEGTTLRPPSEETSFSRSQYLRPQKATNHLKTTSLQAHDEEWEGEQPDPQQQGHWPPLYYPPPPQGQNYYAPYGPPVPGLILSPYGQPVMSPNSWATLPAAMIPPEEYSRHSSGRHRHAHHHNAGGSLDRSRKRHNRYRTNDSSRTHQNGQRMTNGTQEAGDSKRQLRPSSESGAYDRIENVPILEPAPTGHKTGANPVSSYDAVPRQGRGPEREVSAERQEDEVIQRKLQQIEREPSSEGGRVYTSRFVFNSGKPVSNAPRYDIPLQSTQNLRSANLSSRQIEPTVVASTVPTSSRASFLQSSSTTSSTTDAPRTVTASSTEYKQVQPLHVQTTLQPQQQQQSVLSPPKVSEPGLVYNSQMVRDLNRRFMQMSTSQAQKSPSSARLQYLQNISSPAEQAKQVSTPVHVGRGPVVKEMVQRYSGGEAFFPNQNRQDDTSAVELSELDEALASGEISFSDEVDYSSAR
ncbi:hypothetical protein AAHC03_020994 [Spirometra sp. Aus1]